MRQWRGGETGSEEVGVSGGALAWLSHPRNTRSCTQNRGRDRLHRSEAGLAAPVSVPALSLQSGIPGVFCPSPLGAMVTSSNSGHLD